MSDAASPVLGHWPYLDKLLRDAEANTDHVRTNTRAQAGLLYHLSDPAHGFWHMPAEHQMEVVHRLMALVPRIGNNTEPKRLTELLFRLWETTEPLEALSRAVKVEDLTPRPRVLDELVYPTTGLIGTFLDWNGHSSCPVAYSYWAAVAMIGAACRYNFFIDRNSDTLRMNWFIILVGKKGTFKSTGLDAACEVLRHLNCHAHQWKPGTALPDFSEQHPYQVRFLPEDTNQATLVKALATQPLLLKGQLMRPEETGLLALDELQTLFGKDTWQIERVVPFFNRIYADKPYVYQTIKGGKITIQNPAVTLIGCCPPEIMRLSVSPALFHGGFMDRTHIIYREPLVGGASEMYPTPKPRDPLLAATLARALYQLSARRHREEIVATPEGKEYFEKWFRLQPEPEDERDYSLPRKANHLWKHAAILSISSGDVPLIHAQHFEQAARIMEVERHHFRKLLGEMDAPPEALQMQQLQDILFRAGAVEPAYIMRSTYFDMLRTRKGLCPPTMKAVPLLEDLEKSGRVNHLLNVGKGNTQGQAYQLTKSAAGEIKGRIPSVPPTPLVQRPPSPQGPAETASPELEAAQLARALGSSQEPE